MTLASETRGPILEESQTDAVVIPVNTVGVMGAGLARACRDRYPDLYYHYKKLTRKKYFHRECIAIYTPKGERRQIWLAATKDHFRDASTEELIDRTLAHLVELSQNRSMQHIVLPALGCGRGELSYRDNLKPLLDKHLANAATDFHIRFAEKTE